MAVFGWTVTSCKSDDEVVTQKSEKQLLEGKWNMVKEEVYFDDVLEDTQDLKTDGCDYDFFHFYADETKEEVYFNNDCNQSEYDGTWNYNEATKELTIVDSEDDYTMIYRVLNIDASSLEIQMINENGDVIREEVKIITHLNR
ncbi:MAG TPA: lipocalin family protein [Flavobacterium sp.]|nr:lipocalin family protein [Flavobacterium sp.]